MTGAGTVRSSQWSLVFSSTSAKLWTLAVATAIAFILSFAVGRYAVSPATTVEILISRFADIPRDWTSQAETVVLAIRLPRIVAALLVGLALSTSGAAFQGLFR